MNRRGRPKKKLIADREVSLAMSSLGRIGGLARAQKMSPEERRASAFKASNAAAEARKNRAEGLKQRVPSGSTQSTDRKTDTDEPAGPLTRAYPLITSGVARWAAGNVNEQPEEHPLMQSTTGCFLWLRQRAFEAIAEAKKILHDPHENVGIAVLDSRGRISEVNPIFRLLLGHSDENPVGIDVVNLLVDQQQRAMFARCLEAWNPFVGETRWKRQDESIVVLNAELQPKRMPHLLDRKTQPSWFELTLTDTEHRFLSRKVLTAREFLDEMEQEIREARGDGPQKRGAKRQPETVDKMVEIFNQMADERAKGQGDTLRAAAIKRQHADYREEMQWLSPSCSRFCERLDDGLRESFGVGLEYAPLTAIVKLVKDRPEEWPGISPDARFLRAVREAGVWYRERPVSKK